MNARLTSFSRDGSEIFVGFRVDEAEAPTIKTGDKWMLFAPGEVCKWTEDENGNWDTSCGETFCFEIGGPAANKNKFCSYCGKPLKEVKK